MEIIDKAFAGNRGDKVRSDCYVELELKDSGGLNIVVKSKVQAMFGADIEKLVKDFTEFYNIKNANILMEDNGALPLVQAARLEATYKMLRSDSRPFFFKNPSQNSLATSKEKSRISRLYLPGNNPSLMINAGLHHPDGIILDLEDAVAPAKKFEASFLVRNALLWLDFYGAEKMVRINQVPRGLDDLEHIVGYGVNLILVPKCESADQIRLVNQQIDVLRKERNSNQEIWLMPIIESALGVVKAYEIATSAENIVAMAIGLEDYTADLGTRRTEEGKESFYARSQVVNACRAAGIQPIDSVFSDVNDMEGLARNVQNSKALGFDGMGCIHPRQIKVIHENFAPETAEIEKAKKIVNAFIEASEKGLGVVSLGSKMIDAPVVKRAQKVIDIALSIGLIDVDWRKEF
ncbi:MAG: HpcH/HpaI aldolase/citrate lyase family protein [Bacteroidales bacterium]|nr:HpcH/HpaI aldolase/citrate lyase family protein [Bacteroidales bacterium]